MSESQPTDLNGCCPDPSHENACWSTFVLGTIATHVSQSPNPGGASRIGSHQTFLPGRCFARPSASRINLGVGIVFVSRDFPAPGPPWISIVSVVRNVPPSSLLPYPPRQKPSLIHLLNTLIPFERITDLEVLGQIPVNVCFRRGQFARLQEWAIPRATLLWRWRRY